MKFWNDKIGKGKNIMEPITPNSIINNPVSPLPVGQHKKPFNTKLVLILAGAAVAAAVGIWTIIYSGLSDPGFLSGPTSPIPRHTQSSAQVVVSSSTAIDCGAAGKFISQEFGIAFCYPKKTADDKETEIKTVGNKVYVGGLDGQSVEVFLKGKNDSLEQAIRMTFLQGYLDKDCFVDKAQTSDQYPSGYLIAGAINYPDTDIPDAPFWENSKNCPAGYSKTNGIRYFLMDKNHPDKFLFFDIGQYPIPVDASLPTDKWVLWQGTIKFLDAADMSGWQTYRNEKYGFEFKYPPKLKGNTGGDQFMGSVGGQSVNLLVLVVEHKNSAVNSMSLNLKTINGIQMEEYSDRDSKFIYIPIDSGKWIEFSAELSYVNTDAILPTFKFTK